MTSCRTHRCQHIRTHAAFNSRRSQMLQRSWKSWTFPCQTLIYCLLDDVILADPTSDNNPSTYIILTETIHHCCETLGHQRN